MERTYNASIIRRAEGNNGPCQGCAGVAASNASREAPLTADGSNARHVFPQNARDRFMFRSRTNSGWHDAYVRLSRKSPVSLPNQLFGKSTETEGTA